MAYKAPVTRSQTAASRKSFPNSSFPRHCQMQRLTDAASGYLPKCCSKSPLQSTFNAFPSCASHRFVEASITDLNRSPRQCSSRRHSAPPSSWSTRSTSPCPAPQPPPTGWSFRSSRRHRSSTRGRSGCRRSRQSRRVNPDTPRPERGSPTRTPASTASGRRDSADLECTENTSPINPGTGCSVNYIGEVAAGDDMSVFGDFVHWERKISAGLSISGSGLSFCCCWRLLCSESTLAGCWVIFYSVLEMQGVVALETFGL